MDSEMAGVWRDRAEVEHMTQPELLAVMVAEAQAAGYEPSDTQPDGHPNVYFRAKYATERDGRPVREYVSDGYWMPCRRTEAG